jgi:hypothetical protein
MNSFYRWFLRAARAAIWAADGWVYRQEHKLRESAFARASADDVDPAASAAREQNFTNHESQITNHERNTSESNNRIDEQDVNSQRHEFARVGGGYGEWSEIHRAHQGAAGARPHNADNDGAGARQGKRSRSQHRTGADSNGRRARSAGSSRSGVAQARRRGMTSAEFDRALVDRRLATEAK